MAEMKINIERCKGCCLCVAECPRGAIRMSEVPDAEGNFYPVVDDAEKCTRCALCCQMCPDVVIEIEK